MSVLYSLQIGDIPDAEIKPPENVLFVCKLNPVTEVSAAYILIFYIATDACCGYNIGCYCFITLSLYHDLSVQVPLFIYVYF